MEGVFNGFYYNGTDWVSDSSIVSGLGDVGSQSAPTVYQKDSTWYLISGEDAGVFNGFHWNALDNTATIITANSTLSDGAYNWYINCTADSTTNSSETREITIDTTNPEINFVTPTTKSGNYSQDWISANVTVSDTNLDTLTLSLYNSTGLYQENKTSDNIYINYTTLPDDNYYLNATVNDTAGNTNQTKTREILLDTTNPEIDFVNPTTQTGNYSQDWISANVTVSDTNLDTLTLSLYNSTGLYQENKTSDNIYINYTTLPDDNYYLNATVNDTAGNENKTETRDITLDTTNPTTTPSAVKEDGTSYTFDTWTSSSYVNVTLNCSDSGLGCDITHYCNDTANNCTPNLTYSTPVQISTEGTSYIRFRSNDTLGNLEATKNETIKIKSPMKITLLNSSGNPLPDKKVTIYDSGSWTVVDQGNTNSTGEIEFKLSTANKYDLSVYEGGGKIRWNISVPNSITIQQEPLYITLQDSSGNPISNQQVTVYESGTSTIACQGNTSSSGQIKCGLNSSKTYDISITKPREEKFLAYDIAVPREITLYYALPVGISTLTSLQGKLVDSSNVPIETASFRITIKDKGGNTKWGPYIFNDTVSKGVYNLLLGEINSLYLVPNSKYKILLEIDIGNTTFGAADVTYGDNSPAGDLIWFMG